jgi:hypothetical protein
MGEGGAILVLEDLEFARIREAKPLAEIVGYGVAADAHHIVASHPEGIGPQLAMRRALKEAGIAAQDVQHINAHGTSTDLGDEAELFAIDRVFGDTIPFISSTKGATGHLLSAAGAVEAAFTSLSVCNVRYFPILHRSSDGFCRILSPQLGILENSMMAWILNGKQGSRTKIPAFPSHMHCPIPLDSAELTYHCALENTK